MSCAVWDIVFAITVAIVKVTLAHELFAKLKTIFPLVAREKNKRSNFFNQMGRTIQEWSK